MSSSDNPRFNPNLDPNLEPNLDSRLDPQPPQDPVPSAPPAWTGQPWAVPAPAPAAPPPVENPVFSGWDVLLIAFLTILTLLVVELITVVGAWLLFYRRSSFGDVVQKPVLALVGEFLSYIAVAIYMVMLVEGKYHQPFWKAIRWNWHRRATFGLLGLGMLTVSVDAVSRYLPMPKSTPFDQFFERPSDAYLIALFAVTIGPLMEELFFRGFLYPVLARRTGSAAAVVLTAIPFGLMHYLQYKSWGAVLVITLVGVVLTIVRAVTKSVASSFFVHVGYNATLMLLAAIETDGFRHMDKAALIPLLPR